MDADRIAWAVHIACLLEVCADKPGNVTWGKDFWDARFVDFMASAVAVGPALRDARHAPVGETILQAVRDTRRLVTTNTNLGMILLLAPLAKAAGMNYPQGMREGLREVLSGLTVSDARHAFEAIRLASPGGLGTSAAYDVHNNDVNISLREAMGLAQDRDIVAREYVTDYEITFDLGYTTLRRFCDEGHKLSHSIVQTFLTILAEVPDTLIARKEGMAAAREVSHQARTVLETGGAFTPHGRVALDQFDQSIRDTRHRWNPGTTADLIAATLFVLLIEGNGLDTFPDLMAHW